MDISGLIGEKINLFYSIVHVHRRADIIVNGECGPHKTLSTVRVCVRVHLCKFVCVNVSREY